MANVTYTVPNKVGSYDGDMVVKQYNSMIIDVGDTVTVDQPNRGLFILVKGNCTINGTLSMTSKGGFIDPTSTGGSDNQVVDSNGLRLPFLTSSGTSSLTASSTLFNGCGNDAKNILSNFITLSNDGTIVTLSRQGASGGSGVSDSVGNNGSNGSTGQTGGGGGGGANYLGTSGSGSYGSCFSGGSGGGPIDNYGSANWNATAWSGQGGSGSTAHTAGGSGGAGNPKGTGHNTSSNHFYQDNEDGHGCGGLIILLVKGNLTIGSSGRIEANGGGSQHVYRNDNDGNWISSGGAGGGGNIVLAYKGTYTNNGTVEARGGRSGRLHSNSALGWNNGTSTATAQYSNEGGFGGNGSVQTLQVS